jgi:hypothetical protein
LLAEEAFKEEENEGCDNEDKFLDLNPTFAKEVVNQVPTVEDS